jgi:hypothetical protein
LQKPLALFFAFTGTVLLALIAFFISAGQPWLVLLSAVIAILFIGFGFALKARIRRKNEQHEGDNR